MLRFAKSVHWKNTIYQVPNSSCIKGVSPHLYVSMLGRFSSKGGFNYEQVMAAHALHVIESGSGIMEMDGVSYEVTAGDVFLFFPGTHARFKDHPKSPWCYTWVIFEGSRVTHVCKHVGLTKSSPHRKGAYARIMEPIFREVEVGYECDPVSPAFAISMGWGIMSLLSRSSSSDFPPKASIAEMAKALVDRDEMHTLTVSGIARQLKISRSGLFRHFSLAYKTSLKAYLNSVRMKQARYLLRLSHSSVKEIASACGYSSVQYFCRIFREQNGLSPRRFRVRQGDGGIRARASRRGMRAIRFNP